MLTSFDMPGTDDDISHVVHLNPGPSPGLPGRHLWRNHPLCYGPVGLLVRALQLGGAVITHTFVIHQYNEIEIDILRIPWQHLGHAVTELCVRARTLAAPVRASFAGPREVDTPVAKAVRSSLSLENARTHTSIATGAVWDQASEVNAGQTTSDKCPRCHQAMQSFKHTLCECPAFQHVRDKNNVFPDGIDIMKLPSALLLGVPTAVCIDPQRNLLGHNLQQLGASGKQHFNRGPI